MNFFSVSIVYTYYRKKKCRSGMQFSVCTFYVCMFMPNVDINVEWAYMVLNDGQYLLCMLFRWTLLIITNKNMDKCCVMCDKPTLFYFITCWFLFCSCLPNTKSDNIPPQKRQVNNFYYYFSFLCDVFFVLFGTDYFYIAAGYVRKSREYA